MKAHATDCACIDCLIARSSIGRALADVRQRGIRAHLADLELRPMRRRNQRHTMKGRP